LPPSGTARASGTSNKPFYLRPMVLLAAALIGFPGVLTAYLVLSGTAFDGAGGFVFIAFALQLVAGIVIFISIVIYKFIISHANDRIQQGKLSIHGFYLWSSLLFFIFAGLMVYYPVSNIELRSFLFGLNAVFLIPLGLIGALLSFLKLRRYNDIRTIIIIILFLSPAWLATLKSTYFS
jgi:hypothetical protein